jgi:3-hydroxy-9,10-secoandrosta-1,3,5(10)-triene-9,17-dione monooxygenase
MGTAKILNADGTPADGSPPRTLVVLVPAGGYEMLDDWGATLGMRGTGSNSVRVEDTFVPADYATEWIPTNENTRTPGLELHGNPLYMGRWKPGYSNESQAVLIGATKAALESYEDILKTRKLVRPGVISDRMRYMEVGHQRNFGHALVTVTCAEALLVRAGQMHHEHGERFLREGIPYTDKDEELITHLVRQAGTIATDGMDLIFASAGTQAAGDGEVIQRYFRDVSTIKTHASSQFLDNVPSLARLHFGISEAPRAPSGG